MKPMLRLFLLRCVLSTTTRRSALPELLLALLREENVQRMSDDSERRARSEFARAWWRQESEFSDVTPGLQGPPEHPPPHILALGIQALELLPPPPHIAHI